MTTIYRILIRLLFCAGFLPLASRSETLVRYSFDLNFADEALYVTPAEIAARENAAIAAETNWSLSVSLDSPRALESLSFKTGLQSDFTQVSFRIYAYQDNPTGSVYLDEVLLQSRERVPFGYGGHPHPVPGRIEAENFDLAVQGFSVFDSDTVNRGGDYRPLEPVDIQSIPGGTGTFHVGWLEPGEWMDYTVNVAETGSYHLRIRAASPAAQGKFRLRALKTAEDLTGEVAIPQTGAWQTYERIDAGLVRLAAGRQTLRLEITGDEWNVDWIELERHRETFQDFISRHPTLTGEDALPGADPDRDGLPNLLEQWFRGNPAVAEPSPLALVLADGEPALDYSFDSRVTQTRLALEFSEDLLTWDELPVPDEALRSEGDLRRVLFRLPPQHRNIFLRFAARSQTLIYIATQADFDAVTGRELRPGDQLLLQRGAIFNGSLALSGRGTPDQPIRIGAYGDPGEPYPVINALGQHQAALRLSNMAHTTVEHLELTNTNGSNTDQGYLYGILLLGTDPLQHVEHITVQRCHVHDVNGNVGEKERGGIHVYIIADGPSRVHRLNILHNTIERVGGTGIAMDSLRSLADMTTWSGAVRKVTVDQQLAGIDQPFWTEVRIAHNYINFTGRNNIILRTSRNIVAEYNTLANSTRAPGHTGHSIYNFDTIGAVMQYNEAYGNVGDEGTDRGGFDADWNSLDTVIQYNYSHDNEWFCGIMRRFQRNTHIRYNISQNERTSAYFYGFNGATELAEVYVYNNTHYFGPGTGTSVIAPGRIARNTVFANNIFHFANGNGSFGGGGFQNVSFNNNLYSGIVAWPSDPAPVTVDPRLVNPGTGGQDIDMLQADRLSGYRLREDSPAINAGAVVIGAEHPLFEGVDFWGGALNHAPDIGAHERGP